MEEFDVVIIGAGVVGLAVAQELAFSKRNVLVTEKNSSFGMETSSRNSEVIHGGMYYPQNSLKALLCVEGRHLLYELCEKKRIPFQKTGKLIVATEKEEAADLERLFTQGQSNGVSGLKLFSRGEVKALEPDIAAISALYSAETGIIDSHRLMQYFLDSAKNSGAMIAFNTEVTGIEKLTDEYRVCVKNDNESIVLKAGVVINCAGLESDKIAALAGIDIKKHQYGLYYCKGQYFRVSGRKASFVKRLVYPVPQPKSGGLGIHATVDLGGGVRLGPDDEYLNNREKDYSVDETKRSVFYASAKKFMPFIAEEDLYADTAGIRPKLQKPGGGFRDFIIQEETDKGLPGFVDLIGIESPGLTASAAIGKYVKRLVEARL